MVLKVPPGKASSDRGTLNWAPPRLSPHGRSWHEDASHSQPEALQVAGLPPAWRKGNFTSTCNVELELVTLIS